VGAQPRPRLLLSDAELRSLVDRGAESPHAEKDTPGARGEAAAAMAALSQHLFRDSLAEAIGSTLHALSAAPSPAR
jgi:hypothetical protein